MLDRRRRTLPAWGAVIALALAGCSGKQEPAQCPAPHPTFRLTVEGQGRPLPWELELEVKYGGGVEVYDASHPTVAGEVVECEPVVEAPDASESGKGKLVRLVCELWTDGAATVKVRAEGYSEQELELEAVSDDCGLVLSEETLTLYEPD